MPLTQGQVLHNRYRIAALIGQGGFGAVYRAWDLSLKQPCALKENLEASPQAQRQFEREAVILAGLRHPNLPRVTDYFFLPGQGQYLVMDFVSGQSLEQIVAINRGPLPEQEALKWIDQVCSALEYLHSQNPPIIHRDIKPQNIIVTPQGQAMLVDFGISKIFDPALSTTQGARGVTPGFSPPEQYGQARTTPLSDLYSLAGTLYYLLTGHNPPEALDRLIHSYPLAPPSQFNRAISLATASAILKALELDNQKRFPSVREFRQALKIKTTVPPPFPPTLVATSPAISTASPAVLAALAVRAAPAIAAPPKRPGGVIAMAIFCMVTGLAGLYLLGAGIFGLIGGVVMLYGYNWGRRFALFHLFLLCAVSLIVGAAGGADYYQFAALPTGILGLWISLSCLFYLFRPNVQDYFLPAGAPRSSKPYPCLDVIGWLHILLGFQAILPLLLGLVLLNLTGKRTRRKWRFAISILSILCLLLLVITVLLVIFTGSGNICHSSSYPYSYYCDPTPQVLVGIASILFILEFQLWLYLRRPDVRQVFS
jgi:Protein kinase domain